MLCICSLLFVVQVGHISRPFHSTLKVLGASTLFSTKRFHTMHPIDTYNKRFHCGELTFPFPFTSNEARLHQPRLSSNINGSCKVNVRDECDKIAGVPLLKRGQMCEICMYQWYTFLEVFSSFIRRHTKIRGLGKEHLGKGLWLGTNPYRN